MKVLITGGAGFIGSHLGRKLLSRGWRVLVLDNFDPFYDLAIKRRNVENLRATGKDAFEVLEGDIRNPDDCKAAVEGVDAVVHLAALAGVRPSILQPSRYMDVNVRGTQVLLDALSARGGGEPPLPFIFGSSSSIYGGNKKVPFAEGDPVNAPVSPYAASKRAGELICSTFHHLSHMPVTCLRFFTVYGPGQRPEMAIHKFARMMLAGEALPFYGDGSSRRDYTYVDDIVFGIEAALSRAGGYKIYNLGGAATTTLSELVSMLAKALGTEARLEHLPDQPGDVPCTHADLSLSRAELGYESRVPLAEGIERFARWYLEERASGRLK